MALVPYNYQASFEYIPLRGNYAILILQQNHCAYWRSYGWENEAEYKE